MLWSRPWSGWWQQCHIKLLLICFLCTHALDIERALCMFGSLTSIQPSLLHFEKIAPRPEHLLVLTDRIGSHYDSIKHNNVNLDIQNTLYEQDHSSR